MKQFFIFFIFGILISANFVCAALSLDNGKLEFNIEPGERMCKIVKVSSEDYIGKIVLRDIWPEIGEEESGFSKYTLTADDYNINIEYLDEILDFDRESEIEVCLSGESVGDFKGALIFTPEGEGGQIKTVIEVGTWLLVTVSEKEIDNPPVNNGGSTGSSSVGGSVKTVENKTIEESVEVVEEEVEEEVVAEVEVEEKKSWLTGAVIGGGMGNWKFIGGFLVVIIIACAIVYSKRGMVDVEEVSEEMIE